MVRKCFSGKINGWGIVCFTFLHIIYLSYSKNWLGFVLLVCSGNSVFFFWVLLSFIQMGNNSGGIFLLSLLDECNFGVGRRDIRIWSPKPSVGFSCKFFFRLLLDRSLSCKGIDF